jgi:2-amino-4-hydroxy-6-hydroxymethyldihydropteridine diphosphokinase
MTVPPARELAYVALGSNLGDRAAHLAAARASLAALPATTLVAESTVEGTPPLGGLEQPPYLNQMVLLETALSPHDLLRRCQAIEAERGRTRAARWGSRTLDLDIVKFGDRQIDSPDLVVPHPELPSREFWRRELAELEAHAR